MKSKEKRNEELVAFFKSGDYSFAEVGRKFNLTRERVRQILTKRGLSSAKQGRYEKVYISKPELKRLYTETDKTIQDIANRFGVTPTTIYARARLFKLKRGGQRAWRIFYFCRVCSKKKWALKSNYDYKSKDPRYKYHTSYCSSKCRNKANNLWSKHTMDFSKSNIIEIKLCRKDQIPKEYEETISR